MKQSNILRIGCGAGFSGDRIEPAVVLLEKANLDYLVLECLAERTIALAQKRKVQDASRGYDPLLEKRMRLYLPLLKKNDTKLITNMGAANPIAAADKVIEIASELGIKIKVAAVTGDDVFDKINKEAIALETDEPLYKSGELISANAYLGADALLPALQSGADIIITGRVADPSLFVAPMVHQFGWDLNDYNLIGQATVIGHLMECAGQVTGGYFADPVKKQVQGMAQLGHPFVDIQANGDAMISKVEETGGVINLATAKEQLLYEVTNPYEYFTPDVIADFTKVQLQEIAKNCVLAKGGTGKTKPATLKVSVGYKAGFIGEGEISYAGANAFARAQLAGEILYERLHDDFPEMRIDYVGFNAIHRTTFGNVAAPYEVRLRVAAKASDAATAVRIGEEVEALYTNGPAGGGGARKYVNEVIGIVSVLIDRNSIQSSVTIHKS
ncbi:acyclic terpene utilization AtuA family protein [Ilyomonas limi]|uniref:acyclic terpene utilization AtuA family protein n=1 Tax=Ilyomonas limi TaxID=2575867 RepID=UPI00148546A7|nr:acyclic terpene utilization AtuA family protein [Ilyomonas limi]